MVERDESQFRKDRLKRFHLIDEASFTLGFYDVIHHAREVLFDPFTHTAEEVTSERRNLVIALTIGKNSFHIDPNRAIVLAEEYWAELQKEKEKEDK